MERRDVKMNVDTSKTDTKTYKVRNVLKIIKR